MKSIQLDGTLLCKQDGIEGAIFAENGKNFYSIGRTITNRLSMRANESKKVKITIEVQD